jgi:hypothetical protein
MQISNLQQDVFTRISKTPDGKELIKFLKDLVASTSDVRKIVNITTEDVKGRQLACAIIEDEIISRFNSLSKSEIIKEEFE